jgi:hypothetical protein
MDIQPRFLCVACHRGVLNRSVPRCLYCGADLPAEARLAPEVIAQRDAEHARLEAARKRLARAAPAHAGTEEMYSLNVIDGIAAGADLAGLAGDAISGIGDLPS